MLVQDGSKWAVESLDKLPDGVQPQITVEELLAAEDVVRADVSSLKIFIFPSSEI